MNAIRTYLHENRVHLLIAVAIAAAWALGLVDHATALGGGMLAGGLVLDTTPDIKTLHAAMEKAFESMKSGSTEIKARLLDVEQKLAAYRGGVVLGGGGGGNAHAIVDAIEASDQFKAFKNGALRECRIPLPPGALDTKTTIVGPVTPGAAALQDPDRSSAFIGLPMRRLTVRGLLPSLPTEAGSTQYARLSSFTNNAAIQGAGSSPLATEGELKAQSDMQFELITCPIVTIAHWIPASNQVLNDIPALQRFIETWLTYGLGLVEEDQLLNGSGSGANLSGILTAASTFTGGGTNQTPIDTIRKAVTQLQIANIVPTGVVLHPTDWESIELQKNTQGNYIIVQSVSAGGAPVLWRLPVTVTVAIAQGTFLVGDFNAALVRDRQQTTIIITSGYMDFAARNLTMILAEQREGLEIHMPSAFIKGALATPG